ncbi:MAG: class I SAM-dependent methyltransferase [Microgenomates group bacterium]|nr:class I SAM-dependent methyltransferase [Microgenomates group bacterium]
MKKINFFIKKYLENRPAFFSFIRPQEAFYFYKNQDLIKSPVLDFGCGDGFFANLVFGKGKIDVGLDLINNPRVNEALKNKIYKKIILYDGLKIPYKNNHFKTVISNCVLEHIPKIDFSLKEIYRIIKPNGYFLTTVMTDNWEKYMFGKKILGKKYLEWLRKKQEHFNLLSFNQWSNKFKKIGFKIEKIDGYIDKKNAQFLELMHFVSFDSLVSYQLFKKWVLFPKLNSLLYFKLALKNIKLKLPRSNSQAIFTNASSELKSAEAKNIYSFRNLTIKESREGGLNVDTKKSCGLFFVLKK